jgi:hypothetical protein
MKKERRILFAFAVLLIAALVAAAQPARRAGETAAPAATQPAAATGGKYGLFMSHMTNAFTVELSAR